MPQPTTCTCRGPYFCKLNSNLFFQKWQFRDWIFLSTWHACCHHQIFTWLLATRQLQAFGWQPAANNSAVVSLQVPYGFVTVIYLNEAATHEWVWVGFNSAEHIRIIKVTIKTLDPETLDARKLGCEQLIRFVFFQSLKSRVALLKACSKDPFPQTPALYKCNLGSRNFLNCNPISPMSHSK